MGPVTQPGGRNLRRESLVLRFAKLPLTSNLLLAPVAGYCDLAFRLAIRPLGGIGLAWTDLVNARGLIRRTVKSMELVETEPADRPLCIQLYGDEPGEMAEAARRCRDLGAAVVDINMGCPVEKVCRRRAGAALLADPPAAARLLEHVVRAVDLPVTAKLRLGPDRGTIVAPRLAADLERAGAAAIIIHGRTADQGFSGRVDLDGIARVVEAVRTVPVIGNGDVRSPADALHMIRRTGCAGVMIGRAALSHPWIFRETRALLDGGPPPEPPTRADRIAFMNLHFENLLRLRGERRACLTFRQRISWYLGRIAPGGLWQQRMRLLSSEAQYRQVVAELTGAAEPDARP